LESHWRNQKAVEEIGKPLKKAENRCRRFSWISRKAGSRWRKLNFVWGKSEFRRRKIPIFPRDSLVSGKFGVLFWTPDLPPCARMDLLWWTQVLITWNNLLQDTHSRVANPLFHMPHPALPRPAPADFFGLIFGLFYFVFWQKIVFSRHYQSKSALTYNVFDNWGFC
jgi:hypothetical protein